MAGSLPGLWSDQQVKSISRHDPAEAQQFAAAGYPNGLDTPLMRPTGKNVTQSAMQLLQAQMRHAAIELNIQLVDGGTFAQKLHSGDLTLAPTTEQIFAGRDPASAAITSQPRPVAGSASRTQRLAR